MTEETATSQQEPSEAKDQHTANSAQAAASIGKRIEHRGKNKKKLSAAEKKAQREARQAKRLQKRQKGKNPGLGAYCVLCSTFCGYPSS